MLSCFPDLQGDAVVCVPHSLSQPQRPTLVLQHAHSREDPRRRSGTEEN